LKRTEFEKLKKINIRKDVDNIIFGIRDRVKREEEFLSVISYSLLALILKINGNKESVISFIDENVSDETTNNYLKRLIKGAAFEDIEEISNKYEADTLKAIVLLSEPISLSELGYMSTPEGISNLAIALLDIKDNDVVLDLGSGISSFLIQVGLTSSPKSINGVEINTHSVIIANIRSLIADLPINIRLSNMLSMDFSELEANKVFSNPPIGNKLQKVKPYTDKNKELSKFFKNINNNISGDWAYALSAFINQKKPGKTIMLMSNLGTWNKSDEKIREKLIKEGFIEGVISLPENLFSFTGVGMTMMIFSEGNKKIRMVDASDIYTKGRRINTLEKNDINEIVFAYNNDSDISALISKTELEEQDFILYPQRYLTNYVEVKDGIDFGDLCKSINRGAMISSRELDELASEKDTGLYYLMLQNIQDGVIDINLPSLTNLDERYYRHLINDKNLIISKLSPFKIAIVDVPDDKMILANGNLYFVELDESLVNPRFVELFLQSEAGISQLNRFAKGSVMKTISIQDLRKIKIPEIPRSKQDQIAEKYEMFNEQLIILQKQAEIIKDKKSRLIEEVI